MCMYIYMFLLNQNYADKLSTKLKLSAHEQLRVQNIVLVKKKKISGIYMNTIYMKRTKNTDDEVTLYYIYIYTI